VASIFGALESSPMIRVLLQMLKTIIILIFLVMASAGIILLRDVISAMYVLDIFQIHNTTFLIAGLDILGISIALVGIYFLIRGK
jgi:hypothetical protein